ncbi:MAG: GatB/YqeY domain-containing protein [Ignavibacteriae bacterium]|nr:GatB/YqeY domain-containing protein [Ignavibacteriota bacterium]
MALKEKISEDIKTAMKSGDKLRLETLRTLRAVLMEKEIDLRGSGKPMTPDDETSTLVSAAKKRKESIEQFQAGGRMDLVAQETSELAIIQEYLPKQMGEDEIKQVIEAVVKETGASAAADFSKVMPLVMKQLKGKADGKVIQELVKKRLAS